MKIIFSDVKPKDEDSKGLTEILNKYRQQYDIDEKEGNIVIHNVPVNYRGFIIQDFKHVVICTVKTQNDDNRVTNSKESNKQLNSETGSRHLQIFEEFQKSLERGNKEKEFIRMIYSFFSNDKKRYTYLQEILEELNLNMKKSNILEVGLGDLVTCSFGYGLPGENHGITDVMVFKEIRKKQYLVIPVVYIDTGKTDSDVDYQHSIITDVFLHDKPQKCFVMMDKIQKVSALRFLEVVGIASTNCLNAIYQEFCNYTKDIIDN
ncbi:MAG: hypothetical protein HFJ47_02920 [Clostridia bacterium]|nr:hypothetical protein [Clostridia bacterium]